MEAFDVVTSPLRLEGRDAVPHPLLIEASAGSGKTWTLAHLAVRFMLEDGVGADQILLVTFTRDAAQALRARVREHLTRVLAFLESYDATGPEPNESWQRYYALQAPEVVSRYLATGRQRLGELDSLHAQTIHSFASDHSETTHLRITNGVRLWRQACHEVIARVALASPIAFEGLLEVSTIETVFEVARVLYDAGCRVAEGRQLDDVTVLPDDVVNDDPDDAEDPALGLARFQKRIALDIVECYESLLVQSGTTTFSELISGLARRLAAPGSNRFTEELRQNFRVVMIDEFQDTDPLQWSIFRRLFLDVAETRLIVVGDPKQAIYGFRSGSVETFLSVRELCRRRGVAITTLPVNYRSSAVLLEGVNHFFAGADFHYDVDDHQPELAIRFTPAVAPARATHAPSVLDADDQDGAAFHLRAGAMDERTIMGEVRRYIEMLHGRGVGYSNVAVLCQSNFQCQALQRHLMRRGVPAVTSSEESVFESAAAFQLRLLLGALVNPDRAAFSEALRATWFREGAGVGAEPGVFVYRLANEFPTTGVAALVRFLVSEPVLGVVLRTRDGERHATDLLHLAEVAARECRTIRSLPLVLDWMDTASEQLSVDQSSEARRLETESDAVRVLTVHKAKGLEFDTVLVPFLNQKFPKINAHGRYSIRRWVTTDANVVDAGSGLAWGDAQRRELLTTAALAAEQRRLAYVALTRAERHLVTWLGVTKNVPLEGEFARLVFDRESDDIGSHCTNRSLNEVRRLFVGGGRAKGESVEGAVKSDPVGLLEDLWGGVESTRVLAIGTAVGAVSGDGPSDQSSKASRTFRARAAPLLAIERRRWSYTDLAGSLKRTPLAATEGEEGFAGGYDELSSAGSFDVETVRDSVRAVFGSLAGARLGAAVHAMFEHTVGVETHAPLDEIVVRALAREGFAASEIEANVDVVTTALAALLSRPTGELLASRPLGDLGALEVAREMRFVLALGERQFAERLAAMARALVAHDVPGGAPGQFHEYFTRLATGPRALDQGFLVGSLDLVVRRADDRFVVVDYKTDQLPGTERPFAPERLFTSMEHEHYPLQAVLYSVALHRHLHQSLRGYDPLRHLGGVGYYYVRVAGDPSALAGDGFATWRVSPEAVVAASDALGDGS